MEKYINKRTGSIVEFSSDVSGENWEKLDRDLKEELASEEEVEEFSTVEETIGETATDEEEVEEIHLPDMTIKELRAFAEENGIEIPEDVTKKDDIIQVIAQAFEG